MMNSDNKRNAAKIIEEVFYLTDEHYLYQLIDKCVEEAATNFEFDKQAPISHHNFIGIIGAFVHHIYKNAACLGQHLSATQAQTEALVILDAGYQGLHTRGYNAAYLDVLNPKLDGYEFILRQIAEIIKDKARGAYIKWVYASRITLLDWSTRCQIVETIIKRWKPYLPLNIRESAPAQLADHLPDLIEILRFTMREIIKTLNTHIDLDSI